MTRHEAEALGALVTAQLCGPRADLAPSLLAAAISDLTSTTGGTR
ncbi:hypothetical protein [Quadrisphaera setariae]|nr:hypothetical protein [Quadrisphaera setariae]